LSAEISTGDDLKYSPGVFSKIAIACVGGLLFGFTAAPSRGDTNPQAFRVLTAYKIPVGMWAHVVFEDVASGQAVMLHSDFAQKRYVLPVCSESSATACLESVEWRKQGGQWMVGQVLVPLQRSVGEESPWPENLAANQPAGDSPRLWRLGAPHNGGDIYRAAVVLSGSTDFAFYASLTPLTADLLPNGDCKDGDGSPIVSSPPAVYCWRTYDFPEGYEYRIRVRLGTFANELTGWLDGRITEPDFSLDQKTGILTLSGSPGAVPVATTQVLKYEDVEANPVLCGIELCSTSFWAQAKASSTSSGQGAYFSSTPQNLDIFMQLQPWMQTRAMASNTVWRVSMLSLGMQKVCHLYGGLAGLVTTNATAYNPSPPTWDSRTLSLNFQVGAPHSLANGETFKGYYSLVLNKDFAKCLWGPDYLTGRASVSAVYGNGQEEIATTSLTTQGQWLRFSATGFHFSMPVIRATIDVPAALSTKVKATISKITCLKGKQKQIVSGAKPKCPSGYKKK
jgi:hypothetical protein